MNTEDETAKEQVSWPSDNKAATPPDDNDEVRVPRKREREVSLEPQTPQASSTDADTNHSDTKDRRAPAKKNRVSAQLDSTREEEEQNVESLPGSADGRGTSGSPPTETKIRQISQGVEDLTWQNMPKTATPDIERTDPVAVHAPMDTEQTTGSTAEEPAVVPPLLRGENPPLVIDEAGEDEHAGEADPAEVPPTALPEDAAPGEGESHEEATPPPDSVMQSPRKDVNALSRRSSDDSFDEEKVLKRKLGDRTVSERKIPADLLGNDSKPATTATKRLRDDDTDVNPRETKRPTPPPDEEKAAAEGSSQPINQTQVASTIQTQRPSTPPPKLGGFMAYASTSSPFSSIKGPNVFSGKQWTRSGPSVASTSASPMVVSPAPKLGTSSFSNTLGSSSFSSNVLGSPSPQPSGLKRSGFEAFASTASPFATAAKRSKSPPPQSLFGHRSGSPARHHSPSRASLNPFSAYATGTAHGFSAPAQSVSGSATPALGENGADTAASAATPTQNGDAEAASEAAEPEKEVSFAERLRSQKEDDDTEDDHKKLNLTEQEVQTGEEDEDTVYQVRGKLYALSPQNQWKERGTGQLKLNVRREDGEGARLLMRKEAVYTLLLNATLFKGMKCFLAQDPRYIRFSVFENGATTHYNLRVSNAKVAAELLEEINMHIP